MLRKYIFLFVTLLLLLAFLPGALAQTASGWKTEVVGKNVVMTPIDLAAGELYQITIYPRIRLNGVEITEFIDGFADREVAALGKPFGKAEPAKARDHSAALTTRTFAAVPGDFREAGYRADF